MNVRVEVLGVGPVLLGGKTAPRCTVEVGPSKGETTSQVEDVTRMATECAERLLRAVGQAPKLEVPDLSRWVERESVVDALRAGAAEDSAASQVEYVSELVGWSAEDDPELVVDAEGTARAADPPGPEVG